MKSAPSPWNRRLASCAVTAGILLLLAAFLAFLLIPLLFRSDRNHVIPEKEEEDEMRRKIYGR
jgi:hypothetical protein